MTDRQLRETVEEAYRAHRDDLWRLCYDFTGSKSDADELTQKTFVRLHENPPDDLDRSLKGWLRQVAANLARDRLRRRNRVESTGPWLPAPVGAGAGWKTEAAGDPEARYAELESVRYSFLVALEELTANQRSVLLLRDVYDLSVRETAEALGLTESNVKVTHHRARKRLPEGTGPADATERPDEATRELLDELMEAIVAEDHERLGELFAEDVRALSDGGEYAAATRPIEGRERVLAFLLGLRTNGPAPDRWSIVDSNAGATLVVEFDDPPPRQAPRVAVQVKAGGHRRIDDLYMVMASSKVRHLPVGSPGGSTR